MVIAFDENGRTVSIITVRAVGTGAAYLIVCMSLILVESRMRTKYNKLQLFLSAAIS